MVPDWRGSRWPRVDPAMPDALPGRLRLAALAPKLQPADSLARNAPVKATGVGCVPAVACYFIFLLDRAADRIE
jgi:hypothetical protein